MGLGYQGFAKFYKEGPASNGATPQGGFVVLATSADVNRVKTLLFSDSVKGMGWYNASANTHYADGPERYEGTIATDMQFGADGIIWDYIARFALTDRAYPRSLSISPDGGRMFHYWTSGLHNAGIDKFGAWCTSYGISTSPEALLSANMGILALERTMTDPDMGTAFNDFQYVKQVTGVVGKDCETFSTTGPLNPGGVSLNPIPYWRCDAKLYRASDKLGDQGGYAGPFDDNPLKVPQSGLETVEFSLDISHNTQVVYTCSGAPTPSALMQGTIEVTGSVTLFNQIGVFDPVLGPTGQQGTSLKPYMFAENTWFLIKISDGADGYAYIECPAVAFESDDYSITGMNEVVNRSFSIRGLGGRCAENLVLPPVIFSDHSGAFMEPIGWLTDIKEGSAQAGAAGGNLPGRFGPDYVTLPRTGGGDTLSGVDAGPATFVAITTTTAQFAVGTDVQINAVTEPVMTIEPRQWTVTASAGALNPLAEGTRINRVTGLLTIASDQLSTSIDVTITVGSQRAVRTYELWVMATGIIITDPMAATAVQIDEHEVVDNVVTFTVRIVPDATTDVPVWSVAGFSSEDTEIVTAAGSLDGELTIGTDELTGTPTEPGQKVFVVMVRVGGVFDSHRYTLEFDGSEYTILN